MRDDIWLTQRFDQIWELFFPEVERKDVYIRWKGKWKNKFGHITRKNNKTEIAINKIFKNLQVPEDVIKLTIAHEIVHYSHGFHSHLPRKYRHPHKGGIVEKDLKARGFSYMLKKEKEWQKTEWMKLYRELMPHKLNSIQPKIIQPKQRTIFSFFK